MQPKLIPFILISSILLIFSSCSLFNPAAKATMVIQSPTYNSGSRAMADHNKTCSVDGLRLWIHDICVETPEEIMDRTDIWQSSSREGEMIDLRSTEDVQKISASITLPVLNIKQIRITFMDHFAIKTYINYTDGNYYYTTTAGVVSHPGTFDVSNPPADYDFYHYSFVHPTTGVPGDETIYQTQYAFNPNGIDVDEDKEYVFDIYVDLVNLVNFWDGTPGERGSPFSWAFVEEGYTPEQYYPDNVPAFGAEYIPFCFIIYEAGQPHSPVMETYISSYYQSDLAPLYNTNSVELTTFTYIFLDQDDLVPIYGSVRGEGMGGDGIYANFLPNPAGGFDFKVYNWTGAYENDYDDRFIIADVTGFKRLDIGQISTFNYVYQDWQPYEKYLMRIK